MRLRIIVRINNDRNYTEVNKNKTNNLRSNYLNFNQKKKKKKRRKKRPNHNILKQFELYTKKEKQKKKKIQQKIW